jgi:hypothetical protein
MTWSPAVFGSVMAATLRNPVAAPSIDVEISTSFGQNASDGSFQIGSGPAGGRLIVTPETSAESCAKNENTTSGFVPHDSQTVFGSPSIALSTLYSRASSRRRVSTRPPISSPTRLPVRAGADAGCAKARPAADSANTAMPLRTYLLARPIRMPTTM